MGEKIKIHCSHTELRDPTSLVEHPRNYNTHPAEQIRLLSKIIKHQGWRNPITVSKRSGFVVKGHGRLAAAMLLETEKVPVDVQDYKDEASEVADMIADNRIAELAEADQDALKDLLVDDLFTDFDLELTGFDPKEIDFEINESEATDDSDHANELESKADELQKHWGTDHGQIWKLGEHRLMCGDSTNHDHVDKLMDGEKSDICFTSPPYGLGKNIKLRKKNALSKNNSAYDEHEDDPDGWLELMTKWVDNCRKNVTENISINVQPLANNKRDLFKFIQNEVDNLADIATWDKGHAAPVIASGVMSSRFEWVILLSYKNAKRTVPHSSWRGTLQNVYSGAGSRNNDYATIHGATMPVHLASWVIGDLHNVCNSVYEPFNGTGTTIISCEQLNRKCYAMEISPQYVAVAIQRWHDLTGEKPELISDVNENSKN